MKTWRFHYPVTIMSRVLNVSRGGFYVWLNRKPSRRAKEDEILKVAIKAAHKRTRESYSARRLQPELAADGYIAGTGRNWGDVLIYLSIAIFIVSPGESPNLFAGWGIG